MIVVVGLGISAAVTAAAILVMGLQKHRYSASRARLACALWVVACASLTYWISVSLAEGFLKHLALFIVIMLGATFFLNVLRPRPFGRDCD